MGEGIFLRRNVFGAGLGTVWAASHAEGLCFLGGSWEKGGRGSGIQGWQGPGLCVSGHLSLIVLVYKMGTKVRDFYEDCIGDLELNDQLITLFCFFLIYLFIFGCVGSSLLHEGFL